MASHSLAPVLKPCNLCLMLVFQSNPCTTFSSRSSVLGRVVLHHSSVPRAFHHFHVCSMGPGQVWVKHKFWLECHPCFQLPCQSEIEDILRLPLHVADPGFSAATMSSTAAIIPKKTYRFTQKKACGSVRSHAKRKQTEVDCHENSLQVHLASFESIARGIRGIAMTRAAPGLSK